VCSDAVLSPSLSVSVLHTILFFFDLSSPHFFLPTLTQSTEVEEQERESKPSGKRRKEKENFFGKKAKKRKNRT